MRLPVRNGLNICKGLENDDYLLIQSLAAVCNQHDGIELKLNHFLLRKRPAEESNDFLFFKAGELIGYLGIYQFNQHEVELSGMVHPSARRHGVFSTLVRVAMGEIERRSITKLIFMNAQTSESGRAFLSSLGAKYSFSEYWMQLIHDAPPVVPINVRLRQYQSTDRDAVGRALSDGFDMPLEDAFASLDEDISGAEADSVRYVIDRGGDVIGTLAVHYATSTSAFIFGFAILPEERGHGYGRQSLVLAIEQAKERHCTTVELEVAVANAGALSLYQSCGFEVLRANDYYVLYT